MSEENEPYIVNVKDNIRPVVYLAAQRLSDFLKQFNKMTDIERIACIRRIDEKDASLLTEFYDKIFELINPAEVKK